MREINNKKGFTLIELLVVISIIGLLSSVVLAGLTSARKKAQAAKFVSEMNQIKTAFELYRNDKGKYPFYGNSFSGDDISYTTLTTALFGGKGLNDELVLNKYIPYISKLSDCQTSCYQYGPIPEDYGYTVYTPTTPDSLPYKYSCGGKYFKEYQFFACNNSITPNYPYQDGYPGCYCFGQ